MHDSDIYCKLRVVVETGEYMFATTFKLGRNCPKELDPLGE
jgi:hypothetical protein